MILPTVQRIRSARCAKTSLQRNDKVELWAMQATEILLRRRYGPNNRCFWRSGTIDDKNFGIDMFFGKEFVAIRGKQIDDPDQWKCRKNDILLRASTLNGEQKSELQKLIGNAERKPTLYCYCYFRPDGAMLGYHLIDVAKMVAHLRSKPPEIVKPSGDAINQYTAFAVLKTSTFSDDTILETVCRPYPR